MRKLLEKFLFQVLEKLNLPDINTLPARNKLRNVCPSVAKPPVTQKQNLVLGFIPRLLFDLGIKMIAPSVW